MTEPTPTTLADAIEEIERLRHELSIMRINRELEIESLLKIVEELEEEK